MTAMNFSYLNIFKYKDFGLWDSKSYQKESITTQFRYPLVKLNEVIITRREFINVDDTFKYKRCRVQFYANGVELRDIVKGSEIKTKRQQICKTNDFLVAEIDAKLGGYGIVPKNLEGAIVSNHYFLYEIDKLQLSPQFLELYIKTAEFHKQIKAIGSTNYAAIRSSHVLDYKIPLPNLTTQSQIVTQYNYKLIKAQNAENQANELEKGIENYLLDELEIEVPEIFETKKGLQLVRLKELSRWDLWNSNVEMNSKFNLKKMNDLILQISTGTTPPTSNAEYFNGNIEFYTPSDLTNNIYLSKAGRTVSELAVSHKKVRIFPKNTLLYVGIGSTVGKVGIVGNDFATANQQITGIVFKEELNIEYIYYFFNYNKRFTTKESSKTTLPIVNQKAILNIKIPIPPIEIQTQIVNHITSQKEQIKTLRHQAETLRKQAKEEFEQEIFI